MLVVLFVCLFVILFSSKCLILPFLITFFLKKIFLTNRSSEMSFGGVSGLRKKILKIFQNICWVLCLFVCLLFCCQANSRKWVFLTTFLSWKPVYRCISENFFFWAHLRIFRSFDWPRPFFPIPTFVALDNSTFSIAITVDEKNLRGGSQSDCVLA